MTPPNSSPRDFADDGDDRRLEQLLRDAAPAYINDAGFSTRVLGALPPSRRLEQLLRDAAPARIDDAGFSTRVLGALPPSRRQAKTRRLALIGAGTVLGVATAALLGGSQSAASASDLTVLIATWSELPLSFGGVSATLGATVSLLAVWACALGVRRPLRWQVSGLRRQDPRRRNTSPLDGAYRPSRLRPSFPQAGIGGRAGSCGRLDRHFPRTRPRHLNAYVFPRAISLANEPIPVPIPPAAVPPKVLPAPETSPRRSPRGGRTSPWQEWRRIREWTPWDWRNRIRIRFFEFFRSSGDLPERLRTVPIGFARAQGAVSGRLTEGQIPLHRIPMAHVRCAYFCFVVATHAA